MAKAPALLRKFIKASGNTAEAFAAKIGVGTNTLSTWVNEHKIPQRKHRLAMAALTGLAIGTEEDWLDQ